MLNKEFFFPIALFDYVTYWSNWKYFPLSIQELILNKIDFYFQAQSFSAVLPILDIDITKISREDEHFDPCSLLLYYYYGGCIYLAVKQFEKALYFFEVCILPRKHCRQLRKHCKQL